MLLKANSQPNFLRVQKFSKNKSLMRFLIRNLQTWKLQLSALPVFKTPQMTSTVKFLFSEAGAGFLQSNCSKQQLKFARRLADVLKKDFTMDVLICKKLRRAKLKTSKRKIDFLRSRCRCWRQCRCWCRDANAEISNWPTINSPEGLTTMFLLSQ